MNVAVVLLCLGATAQAGEFDLASISTPNSLSFSCDLKAINYRRNPSGDPSAFRVEFQSDGTRFAYSEKCLDKPKDVFSPIPTEYQVVFDGAVTMLTADGKSATVEEGLNVRNLRFLPFPGVGLPGTPIVRPKDGKIKDKVAKKVPEGYQLSLVPVLNAGKGARFSYMNGIASLEASDGKLKIREIMSGFPEFAMDKWQFSNHQEVDGKWTAFKAWWERHRVEKKTGRVIGNDETREYVFSKVSYDPVAAHVFDIRQYLGENAVVGYRNSRGTLGRFAYLPGQSWEDMALAVGEKSLVTINKTHGSMNGLVLGGLTFICGVFVVYQMGIVLTRKRKEA